MPYDLKLRHIAAIIIGGLGWPTAATAYAWLLQAVS